MQKLRDRMSSEKGFTLIELLVVMLIIGILAAIAIPSFFNQREKAQDAKAKTDARTAQTAMETWATDHGGSYLPVPSVQDLRDIESTLPTDLAIGTVTATGYTVTAKSKSSGGNRTFGITKLNGVTSFPCAPTGGGCPGATGWGG